MNESAALSPELKTKIADQIKSHRAVLYMKGDKTFPQCGFSGQVVQILDHLGLSYQTFDILEDPELRNGLKIYSNWPTFPQLYVDGELIGGCDIVTAMFQTGDLKKLLTEKGLAS